MNTEAIRNMATLLRGMYKPADPNHRAFRYSGCGDAGTCAAFVAAVLDPAGYEDAMRSGDYLRLKEIAAAKFHLTDEQAEELFRINPRICVQAYTYVKVERKDITAQDLADVLEGLANLGEVNWSYSHAGLKALSRVGLADDPDDDEYNPNAEYGQSDNDKEQGACHLEMYVLALE